MRQQRLLILLWIMLAIIGAASMSGTAAPVSATTFTPPPPTVTDLPRPLVMLSEVGESMLVRGTAIRFVLYDTGQVIFVRYNLASEYELATVTLNEDEVADLLDTLDIGDEFYELDDYYEASGWTDQMNSEICVSDEDDGERCVMVYGDLRPHCVGCRQYGEIAEESRANTPDVFVEIFDTLIEFDHPDAEIWIPEVFEIRIWEFESRRFAELTEEFMALFDPTDEWTETSYIIYVDEEQLEAFLELVRGESTVQIDGRTWAYSVRLPYPHEDVEAG